MLPGYWQRTVRAGPRSGRRGRPRRDAGAPRRARQPARQTARRAGGARLHRLLLQHRAGRPLRSPADSPFYALDLHKCGRSRRDGPDRRTSPRTWPATTSNWTGRWSIDRPTDDPARGCWCTATPRAGSSCRCGWTGCAGAAPPPTSGVAGLVLEQPVAGPAGSGDPAHRGCLAPRSARWRGCARRRGGAPPAEGGYGTTLHRDYHGDFDYDLNWKPIGGFPVTFGWIHAVRRGQAKLHRGLDVGVPNLILRSDRSVREVTDPDAHPARRRRARRQADRPLGRMHRQPDHDRADRRRQARRVPVAGRAAAGRPTASWTAGWTGTWLATKPQRAAQSEQG